MTPEGKVKAKVRAYLRTLQAQWHFMPIGGAYSKHGVPDIICCIDGLFVAIETKAPGKLYTLTANQKDAIDGIHAAGGFALVADNVDTVREKLSEYLASRAGSAGAVPRVLPGEETP